MALAPSLPPTAHHATARDNKNRLAFNVLPDSETKIQIIYPTPHRRWPGALSLLSLSAVRSAVRLCSSLP